MTASAIEIDEGTVTETRTLPNGWRWVQIEEVCRVVNGSTPDTGIAEYWNGDIVWITPTDLGDLKDKRITTSDRKITESGYKSCGTAIVPPGTVIISSRAPIGHLGIAGVPLCTNQGCKSLMPGESLDSLFLYYTLKQAIPSLQAMGSGATFSEISKSQIEKFEIRIPVDISEQKRIAAILNEQMAAVERARAAAEAQLEAAKALPAAYLRAVFNSPEAQQWPKKKLGDLLNLRNEIIHPKDNPQGPAIFVGLEHIESGTGERIGSLRLEMSELTGRKPKFYKGDVVYGYLRPYLNKVWIAGFDGLCSVDQYVYSVAPNKADAEFIAWFMRSPVYLNRAPIDLTPGQLPRIRTEEVATVEINLPPLDEQRHVARYVTDKMAGVKQTRQALQDQLDALNKLPPALLRQAFNGEL